MLLVMHHLEKRLLREAIAHDQSTLNIAPQWVLPLNHLAPRRESTYLDTFLSRGFYYL